MDCTALFQPEGVGGTDVGGAPGGNEGGGERAGGEDQGGGCNRRGIGRGDAEQLGLDQLADCGHAGQRDRHAGPNHGGRVAQDEPDGGTAGGAEGEADADFAGAARDHERHHAIEANQREQQSQRAEAAGKRGQHALGVERAVDLLAEGAEGEDRQLRIGVANDLPDRLEGLLGRAAKFDVEGAAEVVALENREEGLFGIFAEIAIAEIGDDADDDDLRLDVGAGALADADAERVDAG